MVAFQTLTEAQLVELLGLLEGADSVEMKLTVPDLGHRSTIKALGMDPLDAQIRQVFFFDTPELALDAAGVVVRARRVQRKGDDTVVKLRPVVPEELGKKLRRSPDFGVEIDVMPGSFVCSASLKGVPKTSVRKVVNTGGSVRKLLSKEQRSLFEAHAPEGITLDDLSVLGPVFVLKLRFTPDGFPRRVVAEMWLYPDGKRVLELSTKCAPSEATTVAAEARAFLDSKGVDRSQPQQTKTRTALRFYAKELAGS
jgi:hypothetical protein